MAKDRKFKKGPSTKAVGWTQASVSAIIIPDEVIATGSIIEIAELLVLVRDTDLQGANAEA